MSHIEAVELGYPVLCNDLGDGGIALRQPSEEFGDTVRRGRSISTTELAAGRPRAARTNPMAAETRARKSPEISFQGGKSGITATW